ncbi:CidA/LrgA family protein [Bacillus shivajii]|uniref:CidA/LrgA family protein n=1 Tax=Bacillus shivajii TaxID=1983719 RepID=UPI001CFB05D1|nr:CidA/LrgA family protein [Bacillus shivajii]UCZ52857.1 CidA/LrgA family protein [Bacillus shivajii]
MIDFWKLARGLLLIFAVYIVGMQINSHILPWVPGSIIGMLLMFTLLMIFGEKLSVWLQDAAKLLIKYMPLFFVPVTVGIIQYENLASVFGVFFFGLMMVSSLLMIFLVSVVLDQVEAKKEKAVSWD